MSAALTMSARFCMFTSSGSASGPANPIGKELLLPRPRIKDTLQWIGTKKFEVPLRGRGTPWSADTAGLRISKA